MDEADIGTPIEVDQRASNCLDNAARSFTAMRSRCRSSRTDVTFHHPLLVFRVGLLLPNPHHCGTLPLHTISYCAIGKSFSSMSDNPPPFKLHKLKFWEQWTREGTTSRKTGSGATRKTTTREDRRIVRQALVDPTVTCSTIQADEGVAIVPQTIPRHLAEANLKSSSVHSI
ncbi:HTH_Tnp_Tc3_2 domain-containing protein [Trichonephila clavipes]|nr:HTH_Tnp_Tc3_2 domain-containing protein [Trichonephila clavipes]